MRIQKQEKFNSSRRTFLQGMRYAPVLFVPAPIQGLLFPPAAIKALVDPSLSLADFRLTPHYPALSPLDDVLRLVTPGSDEFVTEKYAFEIMSLVSEWSRALRASSPALHVLASFLDVSAQAAFQLATQQIKLRFDYGIDV